MSKFIEALTIFDENKKDPQFPEISSSIKDEGSLDMLSEYNRNHYLLETKWSAYVSCRPKDLDTYKKLTKQHLKREIYGDVISLLHELELVIMENNIQKIKEVFHKIWKEVY